jgi:23S rRNA (uracil1939-C5)-methyltransferase
MSAAPKPPESARVSGLTLEGMGVLDPGGKRVLVPGALAGEHIRFQRYRRHRNYDEGRLLEVIEAATDRVTPRCAWFGTCGGCALQHLSGPGQVAMKQGALLDSLARIGRVTPERVLPPLTGSAWGYRRRARLAVRWVPKKGRVLVGFRERDRPYVADMDSCETLDPRLAALIRPLATLTEGLSLRARLPQFEVTAADNDVAVVARVLEEPDPSDLERLARFQADHGIRVYLQPGNESTIRPLDPERCRDDLWYDIPAAGLRMAFGPVDFIQVHGEMNLKMIDQALALLDPQPGERVLDLYCGIGNFTLPLARRVGEVLGIEGAAPAVERARSNAAANGVANARFVVGDLAGDGAEGAWTRERFDAALLDPPRTGALAVLPALAASGARRILYVSCHPGTLARDVGELVTGHGFRLAAAGIMDMFPQTGHVESMALLLRD